MEFVFASGRGAEGDGTGTLSEEWTCVGSYNCMSVLEHGGAEDRDYDGFATM